jgi:hypothetical protein
MWRESKEYTVNVQHNTPTSSTNPFTSATAAFTAQSACSILSVLVTPSMVQSSETPYVCGSVEFLTLGMGVKWVEWVKWTTS